MEDDTVNPTGTEGDYEETIPMQLTFEKWLEKFLQPVEGWHSTREDDDSYHFWLGGRDD